MTDDFRDALELMKTQWPTTATAKHRAATNELLQRLRTKYPGRILSAVLFGSVARGSFSPDSDIDVLIVAGHVDTNFKWEVWGVGARVSLEFDVIFNLRVYSRARWDSLGAAKRPLWQNIEREGVDLKLQSARTRQ